MMMIDLIHISFEDIGFAVLETHASNPGCSRVKHCSNYQFSNLKEFYLCFCSKLSTGHLA